MPPQPTIEEKLKIDFCLKHLADIQTEDLFNTHTFNIKENFDLIVNDAAFEFKVDETQFNLAFAEILINSGKRKKYFSKYIIVYQKDKRFVAKTFEYSDSYFNNMAVKFEKETPSTPSPDAQAFFDTLQKTIYFTTYNGDNEIKSLIEEIKSPSRERIVTIDNSIRLFTEWCEMISFKNIPKKDVKDDTLVQMFLCDLLQGTVYNTNFLRSDTDNTTPFIYKNGVYDDGYNHFDLKSPALHASFWKRYKLPPTREIYNYVAEHRNMLFSEEYRRALGAQYTPKKLVELQWQMLAKHDIYPDSDVVWLDFACGTCNLLMAVPDKSRCYVSTYEAGDVDICRVNGFANAVQYDFLNNDRMPEFLYRGRNTNIIDIIKDLKKDVVIVMNPPYEKNKPNQFISKIQKHIKRFKCFWYCRENNLKKKEERNSWLAHKFRVLDCAIVNAQIFGLKRWGILMSVLQFDSRLRTNPVLSDFKLQVWETKLHPHTQEWQLIDVRKGNPLLYRETATYLDYVKKNIKDNNTGGKQLSNMRYKGGVFYIDNELYEFVITAANLEAALVAAGTIWNTHAAWYDDVYCPLDSDGKVKQFDSEMIADSILLAMCYKSNKTEYGFSLFTEKELGLRVHSLKAMKNKQMFYEWFAPYKADLSPQGIDLYYKMLEVYRFYYDYFKPNANPNVGLNELKLAIMQQKVNPVFEKRGFNNSITGNNSGTRVGAGSKWSPHTADKMYGTDVFGAYDRALVALMTKQYERFIALGMITAMPSCVR